MRTARSSKALVETLKQLPDEGLVRRAVSSLKGCLAPLAAGLVEDGQAGVQEWAKTAVQHLDLPF